MIKIKIKDLQFVKYVLSDISLPSEKTKSILNTAVNISFNSDSDNIINRGKNIEYSAPTSINIFLYNILYELLNTNITLPEDKDRLSLFLMMLTKNYIYCDNCFAGQFYGTGAEFNDLHTKSVVIDAQKVPIIYFLSDIATTLLHRPQTVRTLFTKSNTLDCCAVVHDAEQMRREYNVNVQSGGPFPVLVCNSVVHNSPAVLADMSKKYLVACFGEDKSNKLIDIILSDKSILENFIEILRTLRAEPDFTIDFLKYFSLDHVNEENMIACLSADKYLNKSVKIAAEKYTPSVWKQWSEWSMLMGLIEKQLGPMRGSQWPATENLKPKEDKLKNLIIERGKSKKSHLNLEQMLEAYRDLYEQKAIEPGKLIEVLLKDNRVWKT